MPYEWQFTGENITIPSDRGARLNIWVMIDYDSRYHHGFCSTESMTYERIADFLDRFSLTIRKDTFIVLDNTKVHRSKYMKEMRKIWENTWSLSFLSASLFPSFQDNLFYAVNQGLAWLGTTHFINFSKRA